MCLKLKEQMIPAMSLCLLKYTIGGERKYLNLTIHIFNGMEHIIKMGNECKAGTYYVLINGEFGGYDDAGERKYYKSCRSEIHQFSSLVLINHRVLLISRSIF